MFSIIVDESCGISCESKMAIIVRYKDLELKRINEAVWDVVLVYENEWDLAKAEQLFFKLISSLTDKDIPLNHILAFVADSCLLMFGCLLIKFSFK